MFNWFSIESSTFDQIISDIDKKRSITHLIQRTFYAEGKFLVAKATQEISGYCQSVFQ